MKQHAIFRLPFRCSGCAIIVGALSISPGFAFAQHGGGHAGGGGGGHFGGFGGGGGAHAAGYSGSHSAASTHAGSHHSTTPPLSSTNAARIPAADSLPPGMVGALKNAGAPYAGLPSPLTSNGIAEFNSRPAHTTIGFPPRAGDATTFPTAPLRSGPLSFSGQGQEIWQNSAPGPAGAFSSLRDPAGVTRPVPPHIVRLQPPSGFQAQNAFFFPYGFYGYSPFFGLGLGFGCDPFDPWGCSGFGYGFGSGYGYGYPYGFGYDNGYGYSQYPPSLDSSEPPSTNGLEPSSPDDSSGDASNSDSYDINAHNSWQNPPHGDTNSQSKAVAPAPYSVLYLRDGSNYEVRDYWVSDGKLHYLTSYGGENAVDLGQVDIQRSVDANAARGLNFSLHPAPPLTPPPSTDNAPPTPDSPAPPPAPNASSRQ